MSSAQSGIPLVFISGAICLKFKAAETRYTDTTLRCRPLECQKSSKIIQLPEEVLLIIADV
ncbi:hypothetical protein M407DRAFT_244140 [Tulasnella calospora MUT 4182]|uniref:Uncharacterized protein n=1 Tax=Tulasnella calospora MUT 4182 TaxID=1051891 RepID=A0A0C3QG97_9AGAM|nr:hypothetical protein M407DRAFT_244140 [Tulasnella calospora MUT 4182]